MRRAGLLLVAGTAGLALAPTAMAGSYEVLSCDAAPGGANNAWAGSGGDSLHYAVDTLCPAGTNPQAGLRVWDEIGSANAPDGSRAEWVFEAPSGTAVTGWRYARWLGKDGDDDWDVHARLGDGTTLDSCTIPLGLPSCERGAPAGSGQANLREASGFSTNRLHFGVACAAGPGVTCATGGSTIHRVWAHLYASTVTLTENADPVLQPAAGSLFGGGWRSGVESVDIAAADGVGVRETRVYVDGALRATAPRSCDYTYTLPCVDPPCSPATAGSTCGDKSASAAHAIDTAGLADGSRQVEVAAVDAAGNEAPSAPAIVRVDNNAPSFAISSPAGETSGTSLEISWSSDDGSGSGVSGHDVQVSVNGGGWQPWLTGTTATGGAYPATAGNRYRFRGRAADASGLASGWAESGETRVVEPSRPCACPAPPDDASPSNHPPPGATGAPPPAGDEPPAIERRVPPVRLSGARRRGSRLYVSGAVARAARGRVRITYAVRVGGRTVRVRRDAILRDGRFRATLRLSPRLAEGRRGLLTLRYSGDERFLPRTMRSRRIR